MMRTLLGMDIALVHAHFDADHLEAVKAEMQTRGAPVIRAVWMEVYGTWVALEGCHRIRAAHALGLTPVIDEVEYSDELTNLGEEDGDEWQISVICDQACNAHIVSFPE